MPRGPRKIGKHAEQPMSKIRVLIVDDHPFFRSGLIQWLNQQESVTSCGEAGSVAEARAAVTETDPDVILMDLRLGDGEGLELIRELAPQNPGIRIVALSNQETARTGLCSFYHWVCSKSYHRFE